MPTFEPLFYAQLACVYADRPKLLHSTKPSDPDPPRGTRPVLAASAQGVRRSPISVLPALARQVQDCTLAEPEYWIRAELDRERRVVAGTPSIRRLRYSTTTGLQGPEVARMRPPHRGGRHVHLDRCRASRSAMIEKVASRPSGRHWNLLRQLVLAPWRRCWP
jgi:hypothetical protein